MTDDLDEFDVSPDSSGDSVDVQGLSESDSGTMTADELADGVFGDSYDAAGPSVDDGYAAESPTSEPEPDAGSEPAPHAVVQGDQTANVSVNYEGTQFDAGQATFDADGDGVADTAVQDHGYQVEYYIDSDGDGVADELTITDADGNLISHEQLAEGSTSDWVETTAPDTAAGDMSVQDDAPVEASTDPAASATPASDTPSTTPSGEPLAAGETVPDGDMAVNIGGSTYDVGQATLDITGDGVADTVVVEDGGNVEYYVDSDGDGVADQIIVLDEANGSLVNHEVYDPETGTWSDVTEEDMANGG